MVSVIFVETFIFGCSLPEQLSNVVRRTIHQQLDVVLERHDAALNEQLSSMSTASHRSVSSSSRALPRVLSDLHRGHINAAFEQVLKVSCWLIDGPDW